MNMNMDFYDSNKDAYWQFNADKYTAAKWLCMVLIQLKAIAPSHLDQFSVIRISDGTGTLFFDEK